MADDPHLRVTAAVCEPGVAKGRFKCRQFDHVLVDTGATHTTVAKADALAVGIDPARGQSIKVKLGDGRLVPGRLVRAGVCLSSARSKDDTVCVDVPVVVTGGVERPLVGSSTLAAMGAQIDIAKRSIVVRGQRGVMRSR